MLNLEFLDSLNSLEILDIIFEIREFFKMKKIAFRMFKISKIRMEELIIFLKIFDQMEIVLIEYFVIRGLEIIVLSP